MSIKRRTFLKTGLSAMAYFSAAATTPNWIIRSAQALQSTCMDDGRIFIIVQQAGGNDGLNTVIPRTDPIYYAPTTRPKIGIPQGAEINLDGLNGLHPKLVQLADWYQRGNLAVVHNVGYLNPNLSHFTATDYYEFGYVPGQLAPLQGWAARFYDNACLGHGDPQALFMAATGKSSIPNTFFVPTNYTPPAINSPSEYVFAASNDSALRLQAIHDLNSSGTVLPEIDFLQRSANVAEASVADIAVAAATPLLVSSGSYPTGSLGSGLQLASQIIRAGFKTRLFYVSQGGYDTHANQAAQADPINGGDHATLLDTFDKAIGAFLTEMDLSGNLGRVVLMTFSEFGRRVNENGSLGTDHGAANCLFVAGGGVAGGVYGGQPDLVNQIRGNLAYKVDFRSVYSRVIESWFGQQASPVFGSDIYSQIIAPDLPKIPFIRGNVGANGWTLQ